MFLGVMADAPSNTLWACQLQAVPGTNNRKSTLRSFDLTSGAPKVSWALPGDSSTCNDIAIGPDKAAYASDTANAKIYRLKPGSSEAELVIENQRLLNGIDGLIFMGGVLYANNVASNQIYRIPMDAAGKAGDPVQIWTDQPIKGPDGMRASADRLFIAENRNGRASMLTINGDIAHVTVVKDGLTQPTAIDVAGDTLWVGDRPADNAISLPLPH
jgi:sugar lactone lactonase YvrE